MDSLIDRTIAYMDANGTKAEPEELNPVHILFRRSHDASLPWEAARMLTRAAFHLLAR